MFALEGRLVVVDGPDILLHGRVPFAMRKEVGGFSTGCPPITPAPCHIPTSHPGTSLPHTRPEQHRAGGNGADQDKPDRQSPAHSPGAAEHPSGCRWGQGALLRLL